VGRVAVVIALLAGSFSIAFSASANTSTTSAGRYHTASSGCTEDGGLLHPAASGPAGHLPANECAYDDRSNPALTNVRLDGYALAPRAVGQRTMPSNGYS
jgi:hypothetical protein